MDIRIISIGTLAAHPLRGEKSPLRTGHATTTLIRAGKKTILVDPGLPAAALAARLEERSGLRPQDITHVFLTSFNPEMRRGILAFEAATWWISETEREQIGMAMIAKLHEATEERDETLKKALELDIAILQRCQAAPDHIADDHGERVDLFPLPGVTAGLCGLLAVQSRYSTLLCGDAIPTVEHLIEGKVLQLAQDVDQAKESFSEAVEIADMFILGRDNFVTNPTKRPF